MSAVAVPPCLDCGTTLPAAAVNVRDLLHCPSCGLLQRWELFPAYSAPPPGATAAEALVSSEEEAACAYHDGKRAAASCQRCGLFVCALCALPFGGETICPRCLEAGVTKKKILALETRRFLPDRLALVLALFPLVFFPFLFVTFLTAPIAVFVAAYFWKEPGSLVRPRRWRAPLAIAVAVLTLAGWVLLFVFAYYGARGGAEG